MVCGRILLEGESWHGSGELSGVRRRLVFEPGMICAGRENRGISVGFFAGDIES